MSSVWHDAIKNGKYLVNEATDSSKYTFKNWYYNLL